MRSIDGRLKPAPFVKDEVRRMTAGPQGSKGIANQVLDLVSLDGSRGDQEPEPKVVRRSDQNFDFRRGVFSNLPAAADSSSISFTDTERGQTSLNYTKVEGEWRVGSDSDYAGYLFCPDGDYASHYDNHYAVSFKEGAAVTPAQQAAEARVQELKAVCEPIMNVASELMASPGGHTCHGRHYQKTKAGTTEDGTEFSTKVYYEPGYNGGADKMEQVWAWTEHNRYCLTLDGDGEIKRIEVSDDLENEQSASFVDGKVTYSENNRVRNFRQLGRDLVDGAKTVVAGTAKLALVTATGVGVGTLMGSGLGALIEGSVPPEAILPAAFGGAVAVAICLLTRTRG